MVERESLTNGIRAVTIFAAKGSQVQNSATNRSREKD